MKEYFSIFPIRGSIEDSEDSGAETEGFTNTIVPFLRSCRIQQYSFRFELSESFDVPPPFCVVLFVKLFPHRFDLLLRIEITPTPINSSTMLVNTKKIQTLVQFCVPIYFCHFQLNRSNQTVQNARSSFRNETRSPKFTTPN